MSLHLNLNLIGPVTLKSSTPDSDSAASQKKGGRWTAVYGSEGRRLITNNQSPALNLNSKIFAAAPPAGKIKTQIVWAFGGNMVVTGYEEDINRVKAIASEYNQERIDNVLERVDNALAPSLSSLFSLITPMGENR